MPCGMPPLLRLLPALILPCTAWGFSIRALPTHAVFYPGVAEQPCLAIKITARQGEQLTRLECSAGQSDKAAISAAYLYRSSAPFFSTHAGTEVAAAKLAKSATGSGGSMSFKLGGIQLHEGDNYFWLVYDIAPGAKGGEKICGRILRATDARGAEVRPAHGQDGTYRADSTTPATPGRVYPFKHRIAPYVRPKWVCSKNKEQLSAEHLRKMTDLIVFGFTHTGTAISPAHDATEGDTDYTAACFARAKQLRGNSPTRILAGFSCNEARNAMSGIMHDDAKRRTLARNLAALVLLQGYEGIDLDWEYPRENTRFKPFPTWRKFALFLAELREELAGTGACISIAVTTRYDAPNNEVLDGADFINSMSYGRPGEHSTKAAAQEDIDFLLKRKVPPAKIVLGLPFFSRDTKPKHTDHGGHGYSSILAWFPNIAPSRNQFTHPQTGDRHFFNGPDLIRDKCKTFVLRQGIGGVCIWAFDTDVPLSHPKSLSKALYSVIRQAPRQ